jgi:hypothetical protein
MEGVIGVSSIGVNNDCHVPLLLVFQSFLSKGLVRHADLNQTRRWTATLDILE